MMWLLSKGVFGFFSSCSGERKARRVNTSHYHSSIGDVNDGAVRNDHASRPLCAAAPPEPLAFTLHDGAQPGGG